MAYFSKENKTELAPMMKKALAELGLKGSLKVQHHATVILTIRSGDIDFTGMRNINPYYVTAMNAEGSDSYEMTTQQKHALTVLFDLLNFANTDGDRYYVDIRILGTQYEDKKSFEYTGK